MPDRSHTVTSLVDARWACFETNVSMVKKFTHASCAVMLLPSPNFARDFILKGEGWSKDMLYTSLIYITRPWALQDPPFLMQKNPFLWKISFITSTLAFTETMQYKVHWHHVTTVLQSDWSHTIILGMGAWEWNHLIRPSPEGGTAWFTL